MKLNQNETEGKLDELKALGGVKLKKDPSPKEENATKIDNNWTSCQIYLLRFLAVLVCLIILFGLGVFICLAWSHIKYVLQCPHMTKELLGDIVQVILTASATLFFGSLFKH